jgi:hypothetical protein
MFFIYLLRKKVPKGVPDDDGDNRSAVTVFLPVCPDCLCLVLSGNDERLPDPRPLGR